MCIRDSQILCFRLPASLPEEPQSQPPLDRVDFTPSDHETQLTLKAVVTGAPETQSVVSSPPSESADKKKSPKVQQCKDKKDKDKSPNILRRIKHQCSVCTKAFALPKTLQKHMATHEVSSKTEKPDAQNQALNLQVNSKIHPKLYLIYTY